MKKQIISLLTLMAIASVSYAQDEEIRVVDEIMVVSESEAVLDSVAKKVDSVAVNLVDEEEALADSVAADTTEPYVPFSEGLFFRPELGGAKMMYSNRVDKGPNYDVSVGVNLAYQLNTNLSIGWGVSFYMCSLQMENFDELMSWNPTLRDEYEDKAYMLPIYIMGRWKFTPKKLTPFVDGRLGYAVGLTDYNLRVAGNDPGISTDNNGLFLELEAGVQYKNFSVAVVLNRFGCKDKDEEYRKMCGLTKCDYHDVYVGLKFGFDFTFGNGDDEEEEETEEGVANESKK
jgi:hypothetical protein